jgi:hypothetical protein
MKHASIEDLEDIWQIFKPHLKTYFPHIRKDYVENNIKRGKVIYQDGIVIIYNCYKRKNKIGDCQCQKGEFVLKQIVKDSSSTRNAKDAMLEFFNFANNNVWLTVRIDNYKAKSLYEKSGMKKVGDISWANGAIEGDIFYKKYCQEN